MSSAYEDANPANLVPSDLTLDELDNKIIEALNVDGRMSVTDIAARVGSTSSTVRKRIRRLEDANAMRVVAVTDYFAAGYEVLLAVGVEVEARPAEEVGMELARFPSIFSINMTTGPCDLEILVAVRDHDELCHFLHEELARVEGISKLTPGFAVDVLKYQSEWTPNLGGVKS